MTPWFDPAELRRRGAFWSFHGLVCAGPSFGWAVMGGFNTAPAIAAMLCGVLTYIALFTGVSASIWYQARFGGTRLSRRLIWATRFRSGLAVTSLLGLSFTAWLGPTFSWCALPDLGSGLVAVTVVGYLAGMDQPLTSTAWGGFGWTLVTTLVQGAFVSASLFVVALLLLLVPDRSRDKPVVT